MHVCFHKSPDAIPTFLFETEDVTQILIRLLQITINWSTFLKKEGGYSVLILVIVMQIQGNTSTQK